MICFRFPPLSVCNGLVLDYLHFLPRVVMLHLFVYLTLTWGNDLYLVTHWLCFRW